MPIIPQIPSPSPHREREREFSTYSEPHYFYSRFDEKNQAAAAAAAEDGFWRPDGRRVVPMAYEQKLLYYWLHTGSTEISLETLDTCATEKRKVRRAGRGTVNTEHRDCRLCHCVIVAVAGVPPASLCGNCVNRRPSSTRVVVI